LGAQDLWVLMLCRSFFTPGRDIGSVVFMMWVLVQSGMLSCDSTVNTNWHCWGCWIFALCQLWSIHPGSSLVWHQFCLYLRILYITASIVIYVDNICILWETDQKCSPKTLIGSVIVSVLANCLKRAETDIVLGVLDIHK
jgi:hypothetical protein